MHQGSALSPLLFVIVTEAISREFRVALPWELVYADDLAVIGLSSGSRAALAVAGGCRKENERMGEDSSSACSFALAMLITKLVDIRPPVYK